MSDHDEAQGWLTIASEFEKRLTQSEAKCAALEQQLADAYEAAGPNICGLTGIDAIHELRRNYADARNGQNSVAKVNYKLREQLRAEMKLAAITTAALAEANRQRDEWKRAHLEDTLRDEVVIKAHAARCAELEAAQSHGTFADYLARHQEWSLRTFGAGKRTGGVTQHIEKELVEIRSDPADFKEWIDVIILAMDGYWRCGGADIEGDLDRKQKINFARQWPAPTSEDTAIEHVRPANSGTFAEGLEAAIQFVSNFRWAYQVPGKYRDDLVEAIRAIQPPAAKERE